MIKKIASTTEGSETRGASLVYVSTDFSSSNFTSTNLRDVLVCIVERIRWLFEVF